MHDGKTITFANKAARVQFGSEEALADLVGSPRESILEPGEHQTLTARQNSADPETGLLSPISRTYVRTDGSTFVGEARGRKLDVGGKPAYLFFLRDASDWIKLEEERQSTQEILEDALDSVSEAFVLYDEHEKLVMTNRNFQEFFPSLSEVLKPGMAMPEVIRLAAESGDVVLTEENLEPWIDGRVTLNRENRKDTLLMTLRDGRQILTRPYARKSGGLAVIHSNVSDILEAVDDRREAQARFDRAIAGSRDGHWEWDIQTDAEFMSPRWKEILGYQEDELDGVRSEFLDNLHPDDARSVQEKLKLHFEAAEPYDTEFRIKHKDGHYVWARSRGQVYRDEDGTPLKMSGSLTDVTEQRNAERALEANVKLMSDLLGTTQEGYWLIDEYGKTLDVNPALCGILGRDREDMLGKTIYDFVDDENREIFEAQLERRRLGEYGSYEISLQRPDGTNVPCINNPTPVTDRDGNRIGSIGMWTDITQLKRQQEQLSEALMMAEEASSAKSWFLSSMSHELRTPMNVILGYAQLLKGGRAEKREIYAEEILKSGDHLLGLIDQILDLSGIEANKFTLNIEEVPIKELFDDIVGMTGTLAHQFEIAVSSSVKTLKTGSVLSDAQRLRQVILNFTTNAIKYNKPGGTVELTAENQNDRVRLAVRDTGLGIAAANQDRIFEPFDRIGFENGDIEGTGIGLHVCQQIAQALGGAVGFVSEEGKGSTFWIDLPVDRTK